MALFRRLFYRKPPDRLLEISERVYVFDCCFSTDVLEEDEYKVYMDGIVAQLQDQFPDASFMVFNFREGERRSQISDILSEYDMTVMDYPRQYEGCPLLPLEMIHHFLRSSESWLSLEGQQNVLLMHCERGGWPVLAFMLAGLLLYRKQYTGELKTLEMVYKQAPRELLHLLSPLNPQPSQLRYLQYISRRNLGSDWPPSDTPLTIDCLRILRVLPIFNGERVCRPVVRIYGQDPSTASNRSSKVLFSTPKTKKRIRFYRQAESALVKVDIHCRVQGDVVLECIHLDEDMAREEMIFRVMFNTAFIRSNILILNREDIDILWDAKDQIPKDFKAEVLFLDPDAVGSNITTEEASGDEDETEGGSAEEFFEVEEILSNADGHDGKGDSDFHPVQDTMLGEEDSSLDIVKEGNLDDGSHQQDGKGGSDIFRLHSSKVNDGELKLDVRAMTADLQRNTPSGDINGVSPSVSHLPSSTALTPLSTPIRPPPPTSMQFPPPPPPGHPAPPRPPGGPPPPPGGPRGPPDSKGLPSGRGPTRKSSLKPFHWTKIIRVVPGSLWAELQRSEESQCASEFDVSELESLCSTAPNLDPSGGKFGSKRKPVGSEEDTVHLIDPRRANNTEIMLTKVKMPLPDVVSAVLALDESILDVDLVENLMKFCPTKEEMELLKSYPGDKENLGKCEQFFLELMKVPRMESKLRVFSFKIQFSCQISDFRKSLNTVNSACEEVRNSYKVKEIMKRILYLGNTLNQGTARGSAIGFRLDSLLKLSDTCASNNKMTLMHYLCKVLAAKSPGLLDFHVGLVSLEPASKIQLKSLAEEMQAIIKGLEKVKQELVASENDGPVSEVFRKTLKGFVGNVETEVTSLTSLYSEVGRNADGLPFYFGEDLAHCPFEQVTANLLNFVRMFRKAHEENCKQAELEKKKAQKEAEMEKAKGISLTKKPMK